MTKTTMGRGKCTSTGPFNTKDLAPPPPDVPLSVVMHHWLEAHEARERKDRSFERAESSNEQTPEPRNTRESLTNLVRVIKEENPIHAQQLAK